MPQIDQDNVKVIELGKLDKEVEWYKWVDYEEDLNDTQGINFI